jgi:hypothetical protein
MKQYCRYCFYAVDYNGEAEDFICTANAPCGANGSGRMYPASKAKRVNRCKSFEFNSLDVFYATYGERCYKPREDKDPDRQQIGMFDNRGDE